MPRQSLPPTGFRFDLKFYESGTKRPYVKRDGPDASFQEVSGISIEYELQRVKDGTDPCVPKLPKKPIFTDLTLKRGILLESEILEWVFTLLKDSSMKVKPLDVELSLNNEKGEPLISFMFSGAWPKKWSVSDFNAMESNIVIETMVLTYKCFKPTIH